MIMYLNKGCRFSHHARETNLADMVTTVGWSTAMHLDPLECAEYQAEIGMLVLQASSREIWFVRMQLIFEFFKDQFDEHTQSLYVICAYYLNQTTCI